MPRDFGNDEYIKMSRADVLKQEQALRNTMVKAMNMPVVTDKKTGTEKELFKRVTADQIEALAKAKADTAANPSLEVPAELLKFDGKRVGDVIPLEYGSDLAKASLSTAGGLVTYDLRDPSLHLIPWLSPIRDMLPRVDKSAKAGTVAHWKSIFATSIVQTSYQADPWINEGARAPLFTFSATDETATYVSLGIDGSVTYEAVSAAVGLEDANATARFFALESLMTREEDAIIGGNTSLKLGQMNTPTASAVANAASTLGSATYYVACVALTYGGYRNSAVASGVATQKAITTPDNKVMGVNGGSSNVSAISNGQAVVSGTNNLHATANPVDGALAYAWYVGTANALGSLYLQAITTVNSMDLSTALVTSTQLASSITQDLSVNDGTTGGLQGAVKAFDGFITQCLNAAGTFTAASGLYANTNAYAINLLGAFLTSSGAGSIVEIDNMLQYMWNTFRVSVTTIWVNAQELRNITKKVLNGSSAPLVRYEISAENGDEYELTASGTIKNYFNPYLPGGGRRIPIMVHPTLPPGTILAYSESLPAYFKTNSTPTVAEMLCRRDYYSRDWADVTREFEFGVYVEEVLAIYAPFCLGMILGIGNG
jgi:hypothetical protein